MIPPDLDIEERRALASPRDWPGDFDKPTSWNVCERCIKPFIGIPSRIQCRACAQVKTL
jgi:hypothetical protein